MSNSTIITFLDGIDPQIKSILWMMIVNQIIGYLFGGIFGILAIIKFLIPKKNIDKVRDLKLYLSKIKKHAWICESKTPDDNPSGLVIGFGFISFINPPNINGDTIIQHYGKISFIDFKSNQRDDGAMVVKNENKLEEKQILHISRSSGLMNEHYFFSKININLKNNEELFPEQSKISNEIFEIIEDRKSKKLNGGTFLLTGPPGKGKSTIPCLIAKKLSHNNRVFFAENWDPTTPNTSFNILYNHALEELDDVLLIVLDEFDQMYFNCMNQKIVKNSKFTTLVHNKSTLNNFFDNIPKYFSDVYIFLISNKTTNFFDEIDPCLTQNKGRLLKIFNM